MVTAVLFELSLKVAMIDKLINRSKHSKDGHDNAMRFLQSRIFESFFKIQLPLPQNPLKEVQNKVVHAR